MLRGVSGHVRTETCRPCHLTRTASALVAGSIKRWGMKRGLMTHGSKSKRQHGSIGASATPSRVLPGLKMAGQMGNSRVKIRKVEGEPLTPRMPGILSESK